MCKSGQNIFLISSLSSSLEFYDFAIYINFYPILSILFFPKATHYQALLEIFSIFAAAYLARPLGGLIFSHYGDTQGRKRTLLKTILGITFPTFLISALPVYAHIQEWAPVLLFTLRILQGISLGGELPGALIYIAETYTHKHLAFYFSVIFVMMNLGNFIAMGLSYILHTYLSHYNLLAWGWRLPFFFGGIMGIVIYYFRYKIQESALFQKIALDHKTIKLPLWETLSKKPLQLIQGIALTALGSTLVILLNIYMPAYLKSSFSYPSWAISSLQLTNTVILCIAVLGFGLLSDKFGWRNILLIACVSLFILAYPCYILLSINMDTARLSTLILTLLSAAVISSYTAVLIQLFDTPVRYTGVSLSFNMGFALFGGTAPFIATTLIYQTGNAISPVFYLLLMTFLGLWATLRLHSKPYP